MSKVWIVMGSTGEYSDRGEWVVEAHANEDAAQARVVRLEALLREVGGADGQRLDYHARDAAAEVVRKHPEGDPECAIDYTGTRYWLTNCPFIS